MNISYEEAVRYMDDGRTALHPFRAGWRWVVEDWEKTGLERTEGISFWFTMETETDFADGWLPSLDTKIRVNNNNQVEYIFFEKPVGTNLTVQMRSAMAENSK